MGYWIEENITCSCQNCSNCGFMIDDDVSYQLYRKSFRKPRFCPECGEKMEYVKTDYKTESYIGENEPLRCEEV